MKKELIILLFFSTLKFFAQVEFTLDDVFSSDFRTPGPMLLKPFNKSNDFAVFKYNREGTFIERVGFKGGAIKDTIFHSKQTGEFRFFSDYEIGPLDNKVLLITEEESRYRYSKKGVFYCFDIGKEKLEKIDEEKIFIPTFSQNEDKIAFVKGNNIFIKNLITNKTTQVTFDGKRNEITNGLSDWVYEEEITLFNSIRWIDDGQGIVFLKFDVSEVPMVSIPYYENDGTTSQYQYKYPKPGENVTKVSLHYYSLNNNKTTEIEIPNDGNDFYVPTLEIFPNSNEELLLITSNRIQNEVNYMAINFKSGQAKTLFTEKSDTWIDISDLEIAFGEKKLENKIFFKSDKDGYYQIYSLNVLSKELQPITTGSNEIADFYGLDSSQNTIYYQRFENNGSEKKVCRLNLKTKKEQVLSVESGTTNALFSFNYSYWIKKNSTINSPTTMTINPLKSIDRIIPINNTSFVRNNLYSKKLMPFDLGQIQNKEGDTLNFWTLKPYHFDPKKKYPVLLFVYGGPNSQSAENSWEGYNHLWFQHLAQNGILVACIDNSGTGGKGKEFRDKVYKNLGTREVEDQVNFAKFLGSLSFVDESKIGIFGWSYGGFLSALALTDSSKVFKSAISVAPVTDWRFYDAIYTERFMQTPKSNIEGYKNTSVINKAENLKGKLMLVHGTFDDNVHFKNSSFLNFRLEKLNKSHKFRVFKNKNHLIRGGNTRKNLYKEMTDFLVKNLIQNNESIHR